MLITKGLLLSATLSTCAKQNGLLGLGRRAGRNSRSLQPEFRWPGSCAATWPLVPRCASNRQPAGHGPRGRFGAALREDAWKDIFIAWAPSKNLSFTLAWADLGQVVPGITHGRRQSGAYFSAQVAF